MNMIGIDIVALQLALVLNVNQPSIIPITTLATRKGANSYRGHRILVVNLRLQGILVFHTTPTVEKFFLSLDNLIKFSSRGCVCTRALGSRLFH